MIQQSTICHPDEQCGVRLRRVGPLSLVNLEAGFCQRQYCVFEIDLGGRYGGRAERRTKISLTKGIVAIFWSSI